MPNPLRMILIRSARLLNAAWAQLFAASRGGDHGQPEHPEKEQENSKHPENGGVFEKKKSGEI